MSTCYVSKTGERQAARLESYSFLDKIQSWAQVLVCPRSDYAYKDKTTLYVFKCG